MSRGPGRLQVVRGEPVTPQPPPASGAPADGAAPDGDLSRALADLLSRFDAFIRRTASRHGLAGAELDEVVQDLGIRIWRAFGTAELIRRAKPTYLYRAAVSASLDVIRSRRRRRAAGVPLESVGAGRLADPAGEADRHANASELAVAVHDALGTLVESRRAVVRLYLAGYDRFEIADLFGWTEGKTRNLLYRGLDDLRRALAARGITHEGRR
jgi:RNA polymerase sigma-70 factor (ECF subfamily)